MHDLDETSLVQRYVRTGNEAAFRALYRAHTPTMLAVAWRYLGGDRSEAEDVVQEAWMKAAAGLRAFRWESSLRTWLVGIAIHCAQNQLRRRLARTRREASLAEVSELPAPPPVAVLALHDLERALAELPPGYRDAIVLHDVFGFTHDEIGRMLGIDSGTSRSQLSRARSTVRRWFHEKGRTGHERRPDEEAERR